MLRIAVVEDDAACARQLRSNPGALAASVADIEDRGLYRRRPAGHGLPSRWDILLLDIEMPRRTV